MKFASHRTDTVEVNMTPMIDIVFQLIAFFMVITNFEQTQADERVKLPSDQLAKPPEVKRDDKLTLNLGFIRDRDGNRIDPDPYVFFGDEFVRVADMTDKLESERQFYSTLGTELSEVTVEIRADAEVPTGLVQELIRKCQESEFERFALKATIRTD